VSNPAELSREAVKVAESLSDALRRTHHTMSIAESLTSGRVAAHLGAAPGASEWFCGAVIAYASEVKFKVLGVEPGPVVTAACARQMARGVAGLTGSDLAAAVTGIGGPDPAEGKPAGTVFLAVWSAEIDRVDEYHFDGGPEDVLSACTLQMLKALLEAASR
jgi:nicotinamide-nucleotide amidase